MVLQKKKICGPLKSQCSFPDNELPQKRYKATTSRLFAHQTLDVWNTNCDDHTSNTGSALAPKIDHKYETDSCKPCFSCSPHV